MPRDILLQKEKLSTYSWSSSAVVSLDGLNWRALVSHRKSADGIVLVRWSSKEGQKSMSGVPKQAEVILLPKSLTKR